MMMTASETNPPVVSRVHPMALFALACSCIVCCPFAPLAGVVLGFVSWRRINASQGRLRGRSIALAALVLGLVMLPAQYILTSRIESSQATLKKQGFQEAFATLFNPTLPDRKSELGGILGAYEGRRPSLEDVEQFVADVEGQFGSFQSVSLINSSPVASGMFIQLNQECALYLTFEDGSTTGAARCSVLGTGWSTPYTVRISTLQLNLENGGVLEFAPRLPSKGESEVDETPRGTSSDD